MIALVYRYKKNILQQRTETENRLTNHKMSKESIKKKPQDVTRIISIGQYFLRVSLVLYNIHG